MSEANQLLTSPWRDVSSYSNNAKDRTPRSWSAKFGSFNLILTRHMDYPPDVWTAYCPGVLAQRAMKSSDIGEAASQAKALLQVELETAIQAIVGPAEPRSYATPETDACTGSCICHAVGLGDQEDAVPRVKMEAMEIELDAARETLADRQRALDAVWAVWTQGSELRAAVEMVRPLVSKKSDHKVSDRHG